MTSMTWKQFIDYLEVSTKAHISCLIEVDTKNPYEVVLRLNEKGFGTCTCFVDLPLAKFVPQLTADKIERIKKILDE